MILQSLVDYYEALAARGEIARPGWGKTKVAFALELDENGALTRVVPLATQSADGKKSVPQVFELPLQFKRSGSNAPAYFLSDNAQYCLGIEKDKVTEKSKRCFKNFKKYHNEMLSGATSLSAQVLLNFLNGWNPDNALENPVIQENLGNFSSGGNFVFKLANTDTNVFVQDEPEVKEIWDRGQNALDEAATSGICLVTGDRTEIARIHNSVKGIQTPTLSPNGWTLVGFDKEAFWSYGKEQSLNAPVGKYAAFAYTTALNTLLADRSHVCRFGDTTVVFGAEDAEPAYQDAFANFLNGGGEKITNEELQGCMDDLAHGRQTLWENVPLHPENRFFILGLAPNAARLSVRFFLRNDFGKFAKNVQKHYEDIHIVTDNRSKWDTLPLWALLLETVKDDKTKSISERMKKIPPHLAGDTVGSILSGGRYPATLYGQNLLRIKTEREVTMGRAGIIKAYLLRNTDRPEYKEAAKVSLNEQCKAEPYLLGRLFSLLENIQNSATGATTVKDSFFSSACATPAVAFPQLLKLEKSHMKVLKREKPGLAVTLDTELGKLMDKLGCEFPKHLLLPEQGEFMLGYYHQTQKRFEKKDKADAADTIKEEN